MAIYAVGEGWTGAMTRRHAMETVEGHYDEDTSETPRLIYDQDDHQIGASKVSAGWGASAYLDTQGGLHLVGRPQDLIQLLRLNRMPDRIKHWVAQQVDPGETTIVGSVISWLIGLATGGDEQEDWEAARKYSLLHDWTRVDRSTMGDAGISHVECSAGFTAMIGTSGTLYTMGVNNRGQCGTGSISNNVWTPTQVAGLSTSNKVRADDVASVEQEEPIVQVALGFQQGYALTKSGRVFSWGKANRGQLGRDIDSDQDGTARPISFDADRRITQIASGMHHAALLCDGDNESDQPQVYHWGKNMGISEESEDGTITYRDARIPEPVMGLPKGPSVLHIACGSHHTSMLLSDGSVYTVGVASDEAVPLLEAVELAPAGTVALPVKQFAAHHDRTTIIDRDGQVLQGHLWKEESLRDFAVFTPNYVDALLDEGQSIESIHRGWQHTLIVTKPVAT